MGRAWRPSNWNKAVAAMARRNVRSKEMACIQANGMLLRAEQYWMADRCEYHVSFCRLTEDGDFADNQFEIFYNKDEANAYWVLMRKKWFPGL